MTDKKAVAQTPDEKTTSRKVENTNGAPPADDKNKAGVGSGSTPPPAGKGGGDKGGDKGGEKGGGDEG